jgi:hypothetical protein
LSYQPYTLADIQKFVSEELGQKRFGSSIAYFRALMFVGKYKEALEIGQSDENMKI